MRSLACGHCSTPFRPTITALPCPSSTTPSPIPCTIRYCNRLCLTRAQSTHPLLCPASNPASTALLTFARRAEWLALHALAQTTAKLVLACQASADEGEARRAWDVFVSLAVLSIEERSRGAGLEPDTGTWRRAWRVYVHAFGGRSAGAGTGGEGPKTTEAEVKALKRLVKRSVSEVLGSEAEEELWSYEGFLRGLGRMSLSECIQPYLPSNSD